MVATEDGWTELFGQDPRPEDSAKLMNWDKRDGFEKLIDAKVPLRIGNTLLTPEDMKKLRSEVERRIKDERRSKGKIVYKDFFRELPSIEEVMRGNK